MNRQERIARREKRSMGSWTPPVTFENDLKGIGLNNSEISKVRERISDLLVGNIPWKYFLDVTGIGSKANDLSKLFMNYKRKHLARRK